MSSNPPAWGRTQGVRLQTGEHPRRTKGSPQPKGGPPPGASSAPPGGVYRENAGGRAQFRGPLRLAVLCQMRCRAARSRAARTAASEAARRSMTPRSPGREGDASHWQVPSGAGRSRSAAGLTMTGLAGRVGVTSSQGARQGSCAPLRVSYGATLPEMLGGGVGWENGDVEPNDLVEGRAASIQRPAAPRASSEHSRSTEDRRPSGPAWGWGQEQLRRRLSRHCDDAAAGEE